MRKKPKTQNNITQINKRKQIEQLKGIKVKLTFILFTLMIAFVGLGVRVFYLKNVYGEKYETAAKNQQISSYDTEISPNRGKITDRNNQALAISTTVYNIVLDVRVLVQNTVEEQERTITALAEALEELDYATLKDYITINPETGKPNLDTSWKILAKEQSREVKEALEAQKLKGVVYNKDTKRRYPVETLAAQVIGFSRDTLWGLEKQYNSQMTGVAGRSFITYDGQNGAVAQEVPAEDGNTIVTTLDYTIQTYAEQAVQNAMAEHNPEFATTVVMNPNTGEIYAMAQAPTFNLNSPMEPLELANGNFETVWESMDISQQLEYLNNVWKNHNISSSFEPGSIVKPIVAATAIEEGVISSTDTFYCPGYKEVAGIRISCHLRSGHGIQTLEQGLANSCNVVMMEIGNKMGSQMLYDCLKDFGFGSLTGIDLPSEASASTLMYTPDKMGPTERATMSFGQSFNATTIQSISALAAAINGGDLMRPYVVSQVVDKDGNVVLENKPEVVRKVISQETSDIIRNDLVATVEYGTGKRAKISGYTYGGKTGTAEQGVRGSNQHTLSFIGFLPAENPQYVAITLIHKPENYATGITTVAPMMKTLFESI
ncbi:MAG: peptidoglycan D,D-transpeptidase FtsI family protein, partial [Anaerotignaceae bacterium]